MARALALAVLPGFGVGFGFASISGVEAALKFPHPERPTSILLKDPRRSCSFWLVSGLKFLLGFPWKFPQMLVGIRSAWADCRRLTYHSTSWKTSWKQLFQPHPTTYQDHRAEKHRLPHYPLFEMCEIINSIVGTTMAAGSSVTVYTCTLPYR